MKRIDKKTFKKLNFVVNVSNIWTDMDNVLDDKVNPNTYLQVANNLDMRIMSIIGGCREVLETGINAKG